MFEYLFNIRHLLFLFFLAIFLPAFVRVSIQRFSRISFIFSSRSGFLDIIRKDPVMSVRAVSVFGSTGPMSTSDYMYGYPQE